MIDTTLDFSCQDDLPPSHHNPTNKEEISLQELLEEFNKGDNPVPLQDPNATTLDALQANILFRSSQLQPSRASHRRIRTVSVNMPNFNTDILKVPRITAEENKGDTNHYNNSKQETFETISGSTSQRSSFLGSPLLQQSRKNSQCSIKIMVPHEQNKVDLVFPFSARQQVKSQTLFGNPSEDQNKVHLPKIGSENKLALSKATTETKASLTESRLSLIPENKSMGFVGPDRMFFSQVLARSTTMKSGIDITEKKSSHSRVASIGSETAMEPSIGSKINLESLKSVEAKDCKVELKPGRRLVIRKRSEPQIEFRKSSEDS